MKNYLYFDIGAYKGNYTKILFSTTNINKVICVEPNQNIIESLKKNLSEYKNKIEIINKAVSSDKNNIDFYICSKYDIISTCDLDWVEKSRFNVFNRSDWIKTKVNTITIDELVDLYGIPIKIKIDVEGYELNVIKSMKKFYNCLISFEWTEEKLLDIIEIINYLFELGYNGFHIQHGGDYRYIPNTYEFIDAHQMINYLNENCDINRYEKCGMIHCKETNSLDLKSEFFKKYEIVLKNGL